MAISVPPIVEWWDKNETGIQSLWDAGTIDAGSEGEVTVFHLWNNRKKEDEESTAVADMINVDLTVRDSSGGITDGSIANQLYGIVKAQFTDYTKTSTEVVESGGIQNTITNNFARGAYNPQTKIWEDNYWTELIHNDPKPVYSANGTKRIISGAVNTGDMEKDLANFSEIRLKLYAKSAAPAGSLNFITRISYQYQ